MSTNKAPIFENGPIIDLPAILTAREERFYLQRDLLEKLQISTGGSLLLMTMVIPGPVKSNTHLDYAFNQMQIEVRQQMKDDLIIKEIKRKKKTGLEYYVLSTLSPWEMKEKMVDIEESHPLGRLFDLDVLFLNEDLLVEGTSRTQLGLSARKCFICNRPAKECGRSRRHSVEELQQKISEKITTHYPL